MSNANHKTQVQRINRIIGQLEGVRRMVESGQYCPKILTQTKAVSAAIRSLETSILEGHIDHCVRNAFESGKGRSEKTQELIEIFKSRIK